MKEFITRTITAFFLIIFAIAAINYLPDKLFSLMVFIVIMLSVIEFIKLSRPVNKSFVVLAFNGLIIAGYFTFGKPGLSQSIFGTVMLTGVYFLFTTNNKERLENFIRDFGIHMLAVFYLIIPLFFLLLLRRLGPNFLFFLIFVIAVGDSGAYFIGKPFGKHKIYPVASPNKSLEGLIAAIFTAGISSWLIVKIFPVDAGLTIVVITGSLIGMISQISDPIESLFKRASKKKDSGSILPGHGGIFDRIDSYIFCAPLLYFIIKLLWR